MSDEIEFTTPDLADRYKVHSSSMKSWTDAWEKEGKIPPIKRTPGGHRRFTQAHVDKIDAILKPSATTGS